MALSPRTCSELARELERHTMAELRAFSDRHHVALGHEADNRHDAAHAIASWINKAGYDEETARSLVSTPSSFEG